MAAGLVVLALMAGSCGESATRPFAPEQRPVRIETTGCGYASGRTGSGVAVGDGVIVTVAHLVVQADGVAASVGDGDPVDAAVTAVDLHRDLALLRVPPNGVTAVEMASAEAGDEGRIVGAAASGTVPFEVRQVATLTIEEVLGTDRHARLGYELEARTATGDSGAGAYDDQNELIGIVFATGRDGESSWVTAGAEVEAFLAAHDADVAPISCDAGTSRLDLP